MPGIAGIIAPGSGLNSEGTVRTMLRSMQHENFYGATLRAQPAEGIGVGWIGHRDSFCDCHPIWNENHSICLFIEGEIYDWGGHAISLKAKRHEFTNGDASFLVHFYEEHGLGFLPLLNGWFSGFLLDYRSREIYLFNDRYGLGRIYYHSEPQSFFFASEAKALLRVLPKTRELEPEALGQWLACGCTLGNQTLYRGIHLLPPGSVWRITPGKKMLRETYFSPESGRAAIKKEEYVQELADTFALILPRYLTGKQPIGMSLTGGLDGRMIMAWAHGVPKKLSCYTFGGMIRESRDVQIARQVAAVCGRTHQVIPVDTRFLSLFPLLAQHTVYVSDGEMDVSGAVELYVNRLARDIAPVRLTGNYGSEIVRGNIAFKPKILGQGLYPLDLEKHIVTAAKTYASERDSSDRLSFIAFKQVPWYHHARLTIERSQLTLRTPFLDNDLVELVRKAPPELLADPRASWALIERGNPKLARIPTDRGLVYPPLPFVTPLWFANENFRAKVEYAFDYGMPPWLARLTGAAKWHWGERLLLGRQKFYHFRIWYRDQLATYLKDVLLDPRTRSRSYFNGETLRKMVLAHTRGLGNYTREIHQALSLELINRELIERAWPAT